MSTVLYMKDAKLTLKIGAASAHDYAGQVSAATVEVEVGDTSSYATLDGATQQEIGPSAYSLHVVAGQVWDGTASPATGLARYLWDNEGQLAQFELQAHGKTVTNSTTQPSLVGTCRLVAPSYGGEVGTFAELDVTMPCQSKPTLTTALAADVEAEAEPVAETAA